MKDAYHHAVRDGAGYRSAGPVLFAFHGTGGNELQFLDFASGSFPEARVVAPRGDVSEGGALRFFRRTGEGRYDFADLWARTQAMAGFVSAHAEGAATVAGLGYSNGANIMAAVIDRHPGRFTHAVLMHPLVTWDMAEGESLAGLSVLVTAGARDPICPPDLTGKLAEMLEARGASVKVWWHKGGHEITPDEVQAVTGFLSDLRASLQDPQSLVIEREDDGRKGRFLIRGAGGQVAEMTYGWTRPGLMIVDHTEVPDVFRGQGVGMRLFDALVAAARAEGFRIIPLCPFAAAQFSRRPEVADVLDTSVPVRAG